MTTLALLCLEKCYQPFHSQECPAKFKMKKKIQNIKNPLFDQLVPEYKKKNHNNCIDDFLADIDECTQFSGLCNNGICRNTLGSFACECSAGLTLDATQRNCVGM